MALERPPQTTSRAGGTDFECRGWGWRIQMPEIYRLITILTSSDLEKIKKEIKTTQLR